MLKKETNLEKLAVLTDFSREIFQAYQGLFSSEPALVEDALPSLVNIHFENSFDSTVAAAVNGKDSERNMNGVNDIN